MKALIKDSEMCVSFCQCGDLAAVSGRRCSVSVVVVSCVLIINSPLLPGQLPPARCYIYIFQMTLWLRVTKFSSTECEQK